VTAASNGTDACSLGPVGVRSIPLRELILGHHPACQLDRRRDDVFFRSVEVEPVDAEEGDKCQKADALVPVVVRMVGDEPKRLRQSHVGPIM
jgi:hypothetical protein